jgi:hypothetical protein
VVDVMKHRQEFGTQATAMTRRRRVAWLLILIADVGLLAWGAMASLVPEHLLGPGSVPILTPVTRASRSAHGKNSRLRLR